MKTAAAVMAAIALAISIAAAGIIYPQTMEIIKVDKETDEVFLMTATGYVYARSGAEDWEVGDLAALIMNSNGTPDITDDEIIAARYSGFQRGE